MLELDDVRPRGQLEPDQLLVARDLDAVEERPLRVGADVDRQDQRRDGGRGRWGGGSRWRAAGCRGRVAVVLGRGWGPARRRGAPAVAGAVPSGGAGAARGAAASAP